MPAAVAGAWPKSGQGFMGRTFMLTLRNDAVRRRFLTTTAMTLAVVATGAAAPALAQTTVTGAAAPTLAQTAVTGDTKQDATSATTLGDDVVVSGQRLSNVLSIADKKQAVGVIDVLSADDLGKMPDASVADSLSRIPGVSTIVNQDTGEGQYVTIRGLAGTYNAYTINGVRVAETDPSTRDVSLNLLPPNGLAAVTVAKTQTPDMDGDAIAGAIDFRTPTAFDFKKETIGRLYVGAGLNGRAQSAGEASFNGQVQGDFGTRFDNDRFGIYASADYGVSHGNGQEVENDGEWTPYNWVGNSTDPINYHSLQLPGIDLDYRQLRQERIGGNFSLDYHGDNTRLYLRGQYAQLKLRGTNNTTEYNATDDDSGRLEQVNPNDTSLAQPDQMIKSVASDGTITYNYTTKQIKDTNGDGIITSADATNDSLYSIVGGSGTYDPTHFIFGREDEVIDNNQYLTTIDAGGHSDFGRLHLDYDASLSLGKQETPDDYSLEYDNSDNPYAAPLHWVSSDPRFPMPVTTAGANAVQYDPSLLDLDGAELEKSSQRDSRLALKLDARYDVGGFLDYIKVGAKWTRSHRTYTDETLYDGDFENTPLDGLNLAQSGLIDKTVDSTLNGRYYYGALISRAAMINAINAAMAANPGTATASDLYGQDTQNTEKVFAAYALGHFKVNAIDIVAGGRFEHRDTYSQFYDNDGSDEDALPVADSTTRGYSVFLPSVTATFRPNEKQVYRAAVWTGYSAPEFDYLTGAETVTHAANGDILSISRGNPDLKPARALNFDVSAEYYPDRGSMVSLAAFYKKIDNFIFTNDDSVPADTNSGSIDISQPENGQTAHLYGLEFDVEKSMEGLAPPFDGFGIEANITWQHSRASTGQPERMGAEIPLIDAPELLYNTALTFQKYGIEAKLSYSFRGKYIEQLRDNQVDKWVQHNDSLDLHTRYNVNEHLALDFDVSNLLNSWKYYTTRGPDPDYQKDYMEPGRTFLWRASYNF
jgi:TonB-dependent receptor